VSGFVQHYDCLAGINTNPFSPVSGKVGEDRAIDGIAIADGVLVSRPNPQFDALVFYANDGVTGSYAANEADGSASGLAGENRRAAIVSQADLGDLAGIRHAVGGFSIVLRDGELAERLRTPDAAKDAPRHPRSAAGLSADGRWLYLLAVDGRRPGSIGATEAELAIILRQLGAAYGLNFDGGGSTSLALRFPDGKIRPVNTPIHKQIPGWERGVAVCLGIRFRDLPDL
jgi:exopolysaccharide biosynthesis protein